jgi:hypothetical protein
MGFIQLCMVKKTTYILYNNIRMYIGNLHTTQYQKIEHYKLNLYVSNRFMKRNLVQYYIKSTLFNLFTPNIPYWTLPYVGWIIPKLGSRGDRAKS